MHTHRTSERGPIAIPCSPQRHRRLATRARTIAPPLASSGARSHLFRALPQPLGLAARGSPAREGPTGRPAATTTVGREPGAPAAGVAVSRAAVEPVSTPPASGGGGGAALGGGGLRGGGVCLAAELPPRERIAVARLPDTQFVCSDLVDVLQHEMYARRASVGTRDAQLVD